ncbi:hypothetical protein LCGC14_2448420, partial [marine sediment metagenome]
ITTGWNNDWGQEYTSMPELENSLIDYGGSFDSGILSEELTGKEDSNKKLIEDEFDGEFEGNYVDGSWFSNPYESENFDFSRMYNSDIHTTDNTGYYNFYDYDGGTYDPSQYVVFKNELSNFAPDTSNSTLSGIYQSGNVPYNAPPNYYIEDPVFFQQGSGSGSLSDTHQNDGNYYTLIPKEYFVAGHWMGDEWVDDIWLWDLDARLDVDSSLQGKDVYLSFAISTTNDQKATFSIDGNSIQYTGVTIQDSRLFIQSFDINNIWIRASHNNPLRLPFETRIIYFKIEKAGVMAPGYRSYEDVTFNEIVSALDDWDEYITSYTDFAEDFGLEFTFELPAVGMNALEQIYVSFDASMVSTYDEQFKMSILIYNFTNNDWEALPMGPISSGKYINTLQWYDNLWRIGDDPLKPPSDDNFRPTWATTSNTSIQTISFGETFPNTISSSEIVFDSSIESGGNFLNNTVDNPNFVKDGSKAEFNFIRYFDTTSYQANKFSLYGLVINPDILFTSTDSNFPLVEE